jgi:hypothetical protein
MTFTYHVGQRVRFLGVPGTVVAAFTTLDGLERYVVQFDTPAGLLAIVRADELEPETREKP